MDGIIKINVGGTIFSTYKSTLTLRPNTFLTQKFVNEEAFAQDKEFFLDRDPDIFRSVLNWYRTGILALPNNVSERLFYHELDFYGINHREMCPEVKLLVQLSAEWTEKYEEYVSLFIDKIQRKLELELPITYTFKSSIILKEYIWRSKRFDTELDISELINVRNLMALITWQKIHEGLLTEPADKNERDKWWTTRRDFTEEDIRETLDRIDTFQRLGNNPLVQKEIVIRFIKLGWKAKIIEKEVKCDTESILFMGPFPDNVFVEKWCGKCTLKFVNGKYLCGEVCSQVRKYQTLILDF